MARDLAQGPWVVSGHMHVSSAVVVVVVVIVVVGQNMHVFAVVVAANADAGSCFRR